MSNFTRDQLRRFDLRPDTGFGQHFLADDNILGVILRLAGPLPGQRVWEPGPGVGTLTRALASTGVHVAATELDERLREPLAVAIEECDEVTVRFADAVREGAATLRPLPDLLVSNLPYDVSVPIIAETLKTAPTVRRFCVMVQAEVADRLQASPGTRDYGAVSVLVQAFCNFRGRHPVGRGVFVPQPNVDSAILAFDRVREPVADVAAFTRFVRDAFQFRRKTLANNIVPGLVNAPDRKHARAVLDSACEAAGCRPGDRPEAISPDQFVDLYRNLAPLRQLGTDSLVASSAKTNRLLAVGAKRPDGYHELVTCIEPIDWIDVVRVVESDEDAVAIRGIEVPGGDSLVGQAVEALRSQRPDRVPNGLGVTIEKSIPPGAGLGGGTGNAAAVLRLLGERHGIPEEDLAAAATAAGSDTAAQLRGAPMLARGRGEHVEPITVATRAGTRWYAVWPGTPSATGAVYGRYDEVGPPLELPGADDVADWAGEPLPRNDLEAAAVAENPDCGRLLEVMRRHGRRAWVSGSGSACVCELPEEPGPLMHAIRTAFPAGLTRVVRPIASRPLG